MSKYAFIALGLIVVAIGAWTAFSGRPQEASQSPDPVQEDPTAADEPQPPNESRPPSLSENPTPPELQDQAPPSRAQNEFSTDFSRHTISYDEVLSGGPPKDGIPAVDEPQFVGVEEADAWLALQEPVVLVQIEGEARAYPLQILTWHEIVNDEVGGVPVTITFCPLCNTAIAFERTFDGQVLDFGTTGRLRFSNLIMYDRQTETWWQQANGEGVAGKYAGQQLTFLPAAIVSWQDYKAAHPDSLVLSRETGHRRDYGRNPYSGYDNINNSPFLYRGPDNSDRLPPMERVLTVELSGQTVAYPYSSLSELHVANDSVAGQEIVIFWEPGTSSALDAAALAQGRDVGTANSFARLLGDRVLTFRFDGQNIVDEQTGSVWDVLGQAVNGELEGSQLSPIVGVNHFWFSWAAFKPETRIYTTGG